MKWLKQKPSFPAGSKVIIMNFKRKQSIHRSIRLQKQGYYVFKVDNEYANIGFVSKPTILEHIKDWSQNINEFNSIKRSAMEFDSFVQNYFANDGNVQIVQKQITEKLLLQAEQISKTKKVNATEEEDFYYRLCCYWAKIKEINEKKKDE